jgi:hypothetical protein
MATFLAAIVLAIVAWSVSLLLWKRVLWEVGLSFALIPLIILAVNLLAYLVQGLRERVTGVPAGESVRLIPVRSSRLVDGVDRDDLAYFVRTVARTGDTTQRSWRGVNMPSSATCDNALHARLVGILEKSGYLVERGPRTAGRLTTRDAGEMLNKLGLNVN